MALLAIGCGAAPPADILARQGGDTTPARGKVVYDSHGCVNCHGPGGQGNGHLAPTLDPPPRDFRDTNAYLQGASPDDIAATLVSGIRGRRSGMPPYAHLTPADRIALGHYIASLQRRVPAPGAP